MSAVAAFTASLLAMIAAATVSLLAMTASVLGTHTFAFMFRTAVTPSIASIFTFTIAASSIVTAAAFSLAFPCAFAATAAIDSLALTATLFLLARSSFFLAATRAPSLFGILATVAILALCDFSILQLFITWKMRCFLTPCAAFA
jgi:hypothetical protein